MTRSLSAPDTLTPAGLVASLQTLSGIVNAEWLESAIATVKDLEAKIAEAQRDAEEAAANTRHALHQCDQQRARAETLEAALKETRADRDMWMDLVGKCAVERPGDKADVTEICKRLRAEWQKVADRRRPPSPGDTPT